MILIIVAVTLSTVWAAPQDYYNSQQYPSHSIAGNKPAIPIVSETNEMNTDGSFSYSYATGDGQQVQAQGYLKNPGVKDNEAEVIQGSYSYTAPDGTPITVTYIADELGFRAEGAHLPTPPPIPEAIQRALELIAQAQKQGTLDTGEYRPQHQQHQRPNSSHQQRPTHYPRPFSF
ncbi:unnamed protein product [Acanthoscelides obtectus]|uniref:Uncharacterized protein n=2 Tax=Acanthoscelides obtectus TaxID=200917 RepID=A0A9P0Q2B5_ACAOB|nr:unnamed protein product [Acanthoscelides obtectus]CAK1677693.1 hypothetical protein AOBTE_LOCUS31494 [Acanthoscelides obtectus]